MLYSTVKVSIVDPIIEQIRYMLDPINFWSPGYPGATANSDDDNEDVQLDDGRRIF